jgi:hypothetical protein
MGLTDINLQNDDAIINNRAAGEWKTSCALVLPPVYSRIPGGAHPE